MLEALIAISLLLALTLWQPMRYLRIRRLRAEDRQAPWYGRDAFHVITFFRVHEGHKVLQSTRAFWEAMAGPARPQLVYAGQAGLGIDSTQLTARRWDGVVLLQYPSRSRYEVEAAELHLRASREHFADSYAHGMRRRRGTDVTVPLQFLLTRAFDILRGRWRGHEIEPEPGFDTGPEFEAWRRRMSHLDALHTVNPDGMVLFLLLRHGGAGLDALDPGARCAMRSHMAAHGYHILHAGHAVALREEARFDHVTVLFCPSAHEYAQLLRSRLFHRLVGGTGLADTFAIPSAPITALLEPLR